jgi:hypothetical protein
MDDYPAQAPHCSPSRPARHNRRLAANFLSYADRDRGDLTGPGPNRRRARQPHVYEVAQRGREETVVRSGNRDGLGVERVGDPFRRNVVGGRMRHDRKCKLVDEPLLGRNVGPNVSQQDPAGR